MDWRRLRQIGAWSFFCDLAGQVYPANPNPLLSVASVAVPRDLVNVVRSGLLRAFGGTPVKWKTGGLDGLAKIVALVVRHRLHVSVAHTHCSDPATWQRYFTDGEAFVKHANAYLAPHDKLRSADWVPTVMLKTYLLAEGFARLNGWILSERYPWGAGPVTMDVHFITDNEFSDVVTAKTFTERLNTGARNARGIPTDHGFVSTATSSCASEQQEPLLLLPDYLAGVYHHSDARARLTKPVVPPDAARAATADLRARHDRLRIDEEEFDGAYPLDVDPSSGRPVHRRRRWWGRRPGG